MFCLEAAAYIPAGRGGAAGAMWLWRQLPGVNPGSHRVQGLCHEGRGAHEE